ncbi:hypothetical protein F4677DRAFT_464434 [Hypoxylon crocopeplum]|nr:hypothetical protein F4677DRAFT_464434 [Hypoxylon crocopeplum]
MALPQGANFSQQLLHCWDPIFDSQRHVSDRYNEPFVDVRNDVDATSDLISMFMQAFDENDFCHCATDAVAGFCTGADLSNLQQNPCASTKLVALLDGNSGLTAWGLYQALRSPKVVSKKAHKGNMYIRNGRLYNRKTGHDSKCLPAMKSRTVDKNIHRLFVASLNRWTVIALAANAPMHQASILCEFIFNHLQFDPLINAKVLRDGLPVFAFEFHLPYFALRKHRLPQKDTRRAANGDGLRGYYDITFLRTMSSKADNSPTEYVYEAKVSCLLSGLSRYSWSTHFFNDLYFETDEDAESIEEYLDQGSTGTILDPLTAGKKLMDTLPCEPREYFLVVLEIRLGRIKKEWQQLFAAVNQAIQAYRNDYWDRAVLCMTNNQGSHPDADSERSQLREELQEWMRRSVELLRKFIGPLNQYSEEWKIFQDTGVNYFMTTDNPEHSARLRQSLTSVEQRVTDLRRLLSKLKHTIDSCEDMSRDVNLQIAHENNESALFQQKTAGDVRVLTWITFVNMILAPPLTEDAVC